MVVRLLRAGDSARFVLSDVAEALGPSARALGFAPSAEGFERRFTDGPDLERTFARFEAAIGTMLRQHAGLAPVPWQGALRRLIPRLADLDWCLVGSAALACRGVAVAPRDVDLVVRGADVATVAERFAAELVEPVSESDAWIARWFARAFLEVRVELVAGVPAWVDEPVPSDFGPAAWDRRERIAWSGAEVAVPPIGLQLDAARRRGLADRVQAIERFVAGLGV
jgi:hypothetical protein